MTVRLLIAVVALWSVLPACAAFAQERVSGADRVGEPPPVSFQNPRIARATRLHSVGARPKWSPAGNRFVFDRRNLDGHYDLYLSDLSGTVTARLTENPTIGPKHSGNGIFRHAGDYIVFVSQEEEHLLDWASPLGRVPIGEPGVGLFNNMWATDGHGYWKLTEIPLKLKADDGLPVFATVNPHFSHDDKTLIWTERYDEGGNNNWGRWRLKAGRFQVWPSGPRLSNERVLYTPGVGTYVTAMEFMTPNVLLVAGNLDGQHEYGMDLYLLHPGTGISYNLTNTPFVWEEGSCIAPSGRIVYMTNQDSEIPIDFDREWSEQPIERDYWLMDADGSSKERLTYFNDPTAPEYLGYRAVTIVCDISADGRSMLATIGRDLSIDETPRVLWQVWLIEFAEPL